MHWLDAQTKGERKKQKPKEKNSNRNKQGRQSDQKKKKKRNDRERNKVQRIFFDRTTLLSTLHKWRGAKTGKETPENNI